MRYLKSIKAIDLYIRRKIEQRLQEGRLLRTAKQLEAKAVKFTPSNDYFGLGGLYDCYGTCCVRGVFRTKPNPFASSTRHGRVDPQDARAIELGFEGPGNGYGYSHPDPERNQALQDLGARIRRDYCETEAYLPTYRQG